MSGMAPVSSTVNKQRVQLLVDALRSGEFKQGIDTLRRHVDGEVRHCCLGVATEVALRNGMQPPEDERVLWKTSLQTLHQWVADWYGFDETDPKLKNVQLSADPEALVGEWYATSLNDNGFSFEQIADGFERTFINEESEHPEGADEVP